MSLIPQKAEKFFTYHWVHLKPKEQIGPHQQSSWELSYIITGSGTRKIGDTIDDFLPGEVILIPPTIQHCWYFNDKVTDVNGKIENITICFMPDFLDKCCAAFIELSQMIREVKKNDAAIIFDKETSSRLIKSMLDMKEQSEAGKLISLLQILHIISNKRQCIVGRKTFSTKKQQQLELIETYIICNAQHRISIDDMAKHIGMNRSSFCTFFKSNMKKTFITYLNEYRIDLACKILKKTSSSISNVCYQVGFNNVPHFNKVFKRYKGMSPSNFINNLKISTCHPM